jgi:ABC-type branched-subunit amino acid transport system substrate-binding protein
MTLAIVLLVAGLIVGGGIGYFAAPTKTVTVQGSGTTVIQTVTEAPLKGKTVKLGFISPITSWLEADKPYHEQVIAPDLNKYSALLGYGVNFEYLIDDAQGQANTHLEKVQGFKATGITIFEGGGWSPMAQSALSYCNSNNMLMWSMGSTTPTLEIADDYLYRMCSSDSVAAPALANAMWAAGVKSIVIFQIGSSWGDGVINILMPLWQQMGGKVAGEKIRYAAESTEFSNYLLLADDQVKNAVASYNGETQRVGVVIFATDELAVILKQAKDFPNVYNVHWWGTDIAKLQRVMDDSPNEANHIGVYGIIPHEVRTARYVDLETRYIAVTGRQFSTYWAYSYDIGLVLTSSILQAQSTSGKDVLALQIPICLNTQGTTGSLRLNQFGDRFPPTYDIWGFYPGETKTSVSKLVGQYDPDTKNTVFYPEILGFTPLGP